MVYIFFGNAVSHSYMVHTEREILNSKVYIVFSVFTLFMVKGDSGDTKFRVRAELALFQAIQRDGRLSEQSIAQQTDISATTVHYAMQRIRERGFFQIKAIPDLERFREIPMAIVGFSNVSHQNLRRFREKYSDRSEVLQFFHSQTEIILVIMDVSPSALTRKLYDIMEQLGSKPCIHITSPQIARFYTTIPDHILNEVYAHLPDRRLRNSVKL